jgi:DNA-binding transcriptional LysR family regulator
MLDRLASMAVFVRVIEAGSFTAAAATLDMSGQMVGKYIQFLEQRLGVRLINRTTRRHSATEFGRIYYERCKVILAEADASDALASDHLSEPRGPLRVTMPVHLGRHCVAPILLKLAEQYPSLELDLSFNDRIVDLSEDGYDLAVRTGRLEDRAGLMARSVARQCMVICASPSYIERNGEPKEPRELIQHQAVVYRRSGPVPLWVLPRKGQAPETIAPPSRLRLDDLDAIADAAAAGLGVAWLPYWLVRERLASGALVRVLPDTPGFLYDVHAVWHQGLRMPLKVRLAVDALAAALPGYMTPSGHQMPRSS